jgi:hypothetical protein
LVVILETVQILDFGLAINQIIRNGGLNMNVQEWVDYLMQIGAIDSPEEYAEELRELNWFQLNRELADQPCDTPDTWDLFEWAQEA